MIQIKCHHESSHQTLWVDFDERLKVGCAVVFKDCKEKQRWIVDQIFPLVVEKKSLYKPWHVGGL